MDAAKGANLYSAMSKEKPVNLTLVNDPQQIVFSGANAAPLTLTLRNDDNRDAKSVLINVVRGDLLKKDDLTLSPEELTGGGYKVVDEMWVECRLTELDEWQAVDQWDAPFDLGMLEKGDSISFQLRVNVPTNSADVGRMCFAIMISASTGEDVRVNSVTIDQPGFSLSVGDSTQATATVDAQVGADDSVDWWSDAPDVAAVDVDGNIEAIAPGKGVIRAVSAVNSAAKSSRFIVVDDIPVVSDAKVWFDALDNDTLIQSGGKLIQWLDKSGYGFHASQASETLQPVVVTDSGFGMQAVYFDRDYMLAGEPLPTGKIDYTVFIVARCNSSFQSSSFFSFGSVDGFTTGTCFGLQSASGNVLQHYYPNSGLNKLSAGLSAPQLITIAMSGNNRSTRQNGVEVAADTASGLNISDSLLYLGGRELNKPTSAHLGVICEFIAYSKSLTPAEIAQNEFYLMSKWGLS